MPKMVIKHIIANVNSCLIVYEFYVHIIIGIRDGMDRAISNHPLSFRRGASKNNGGIFGLLLLNFYQLTRYLAKG